MCSRRCLRLFSLRSLRSARKKSCSSVRHSSSNSAPAARWIAPLVVAASSAAAMVLYASVGAILGEPTFDGPSLAAIVVVVAALNALLTPAAVQVVRWTRAGDTDRRRPVLWAR